MTKCEKLEVMVIEEFNSLGRPAIGCSLNPAQGHWRSSVQADVYRIEGYVSFANGQRSQIVNSWNTMTELVRTGIKIYPDGGDWLIIPRIK